MSSRTACARDLWDLAWGPSTSYLPLTVHVLTLWREPALDAELAGVDLSVDLRRYTRAQVLVPF